MQMGRTKCEIWSRSVGYLRPVEQWNEGKQEEFKDRKTYIITETGSKVDVGNGILLSVVSRKKKK